jgi:uncharacterized membrane protein YgdD (TMEM256/DUF423 family)
MHIHATHECEIQMIRVWIIVGAINCFLAVAAGAFGSHGLKTKLTPEMLAVFEVGARYQMYHGLALLAVAWISHQFPGRSVTASGALFTLGILIFSGSLYLLALTGQRWIGAITPIGGLALLAGWFCIVLAAI